MRRFSFFIIIALTLTGCHRASRVEQYRAEKRTQDSVRLEEQVRSMAYYESQLEVLGPRADSLIALFQYERNEKYQDHGYYVVQDSWLRARDYRILVRDDGREILTYHNGKRVESGEIQEDRFRDAYLRAKELQITIKDFKELENRIYRTSLEIQKYENRLQKE